MVLDLTVASSDAVGNVSATEGSQITVTSDAVGVLGSALRIGSMVKISRDGDTTETVGIVYSLHMDGSRRVTTIDLAGEILPTPTGGRTFRRGSSNAPGLGDLVRLATAQDAEAMYSRPETPSVPIGTLSSDPSQPAFIAIDDLLTKHFAVVGSTGSGKSCTVSVLLNAILEKEPNAHIHVLDPHNEYASALGDSAEVISVAKDRLPFWICNREEAIQVMVRGGDAAEREVQALLLKDAITTARRLFAEAPNDDSITVDTPLPYRISDLHRLLTDGMGRVDRAADTSSSYRHLLKRLDSLTEDPRFAFMFGDLSTIDALANVVSRVLRMPVAGKPVTIVDLSGVPNDIADVVVSVACRVIFDFTLWSKPEKRVPLLIVCEEAHRYLPATGGTTFAACTAAVSRIAREGRKYGLSLALVTQRPTELALSAISQCGTIISLRLSNQLDQDFVQGALPDAGRAMVRTLSSLSQQEGIVFGEAVPLPMRVRFTTLPPGKRPQSQSVSFSEAWRNDTADLAFCQETVKRWRAQNQDA